MEFLTTIGLMLCVLFGGVLAAKQSSVKEGKDPQLVQVQQTMQVGFTWILTSLVPFWRGPKILGGIVLFVGLLTLFKGCMDAYRLGLAKATSEREAREAKDLEESQRDEASGTLTGKASAKRRRADKRAAARAAANTSSRPEQSADGA